MTIHNKQQCVICHLYLYGRLCFRSRGGLTEEEMKKIDKGEGVRLKMSKTACDLQVIKGRAGWGNF